MVNTMPDSRASDANESSGNATSPNVLSVPSPGFRKNSSSSVVSKGSKNGEDSGVVKDVALKIIPKKKVKGNEAAVWGEMEVLKGLDHGNIVRAAQPL
jgi:calcium/calmodulin-dependent protein kinase I